MRSFWGRLALLALIALGGQVLVGIADFDRDFPGRTALEETLSGPVEILHFGDSVLGSTARGDRDLRGITPMLRERLPSRSIGEIANQAFDLEVFEAFLARLSREPRRPAVVLIPINLRTFSPVWEMAPPYQFRSMKFRLHHGDFAADTLLGPLSALKLYSLNPVSERQYRSTPVLRGERKTGTVGDFMIPDGRGDPERRTADLFALNYLHPIRDDHRKLKSIRAIVAHCRAAGMRPIFYVTPLDVETGTRRIGTEFGETVIRHRSILRESLEALGLPLLDLAADLDASQFDWSESASPNEHLKEAGRKYVAERLAQVLTRP